MKDFSISEAINYGWRTVTANLGLMIGLTIVILAVSGAGNALHFFPVLGGAASWVLASIMNMAAIRIALKYADGGRGDFNDIFKDFDRLLDFLGGSLLVGLIVVGGLILLIFPGIIWGIKYSYFGYFIIDKKLGALDAMKASSALTNGVKAKLFVFGLACLGINLLGAACLGVGILVSYPVTFLAMGYVFRKLQGAAPVAVPTQVPLAPPPKDPLIR